MTAIEQTISDRCGGLRFAEAQLEYCASYMETINTVSYEGKYLTTSNGFSFEEIKSFYNYCKREGFPQYYVLDENDRVVGWSDVVSREGQKRTAGYIGIGLLPEYRNRGIGGQLMRYVMQQAGKCGFNEIRLDCRLSNKRAIHLYKKLGFRTTAIKLHCLYVDGKYQPIVCMKKRIDK